VQVANTGDRAGSTVVQVYAADMSAERPVPRLLGFQKVRLAAGAEATVTVELDATPALERDPDTRRWSPRAGDWVIVAAPHHPDSWADARPLRQAGKAPASVV
jgi:beta-glucosidase